MDPGRPVGAEFDRDAGWESLLPKDPSAAADGRTRGAEAALALGILSFPHTTFTLATRKG